MRPEDVIMDDILLQQEPFRFVDRLVSCEGNTCETAYTVKDGPLVEDGVLTPEGIMENMAQTGAARTGYRAKYILHIPVQVGMIGEIKGFEASRLPRVGETVTTRVEVREEVFGITLLSASAAIGDETIASATLKTAIK